MVFQKQGITLPILEYKMGNGNISMMIKYQISILSSLEMNASVVPMITLTVIPVKN